MTGKERDPNALDAQTLRELRAAIADLLPAAQLLRDALAAGDPDAVGHVDEELIDQIIDAADLIEAEIASDVATDPLADARENRTLSHNAAEALGDPDALIDWSQHPAPDDDGAADRDALERITALQRREPVERVRAIERAYCPYGRGRLLAGVYVVDDSVYLWICEYRSTPSRGGALIAERAQRTVHPADALFVRAVDKPHPPDCDCSPLSMVVTCRCCRGDRRITYHCDDRLEVSRPST